MSCETMAAGSRCTGDVVWLAEMRRGSSPCLGCAGGVRLRARTAIGQEGFALASVVRVKARPRRPRVVWQLNRACACGRGRVSSCADRGRVAPCRGGLAVYVCACRSNEVCSLATDMVWLCPGHKATTWLQEGRSMVRNRCALQAFGEESEGPPG
jgi:hypothetical protein